MAAQPIEYERLSLAYYRFTDHWMAGWLFCLSGPGEFNSHPHRDRCDPDHL